MILTLRRYQSTSYMKTKASLFCLYNVILTFSIYFQDTTAKPVKKNKESSDSSDSDSDSDSEEVSSLLYLFTLGNFSCVIFVFLKHCFAASKSFVYAIFLMRLLSLSRIPLLKQFL